MDKIDYYNMLFDSDSAYNLVKSSKDYKYTTFEKFVKLGLYEENWCNFENKNKIANLDFE